jgi:lipid II:glycine glycyltransferase (peptidoglycan interpeptide bridge formation enzyme)
VDPPWYAEDGGSAQVSPPLPAFPFRRAGSDVQVPDTVVLDLRGASDEELLSRMKPKWRYNIKYAEKKGVEVASETGPGAVELFYSLYRATALRDRIALHPERYYRRLVSLADDYGPEAPHIRVWIARYRGEPLAAIITSFLRGEAVYLYGASGDGHRNLMPAYALQWAAIRAARDAGCGFYDLFGIPPSEDPGHPMAGLYRFKTGFGGTIRRYTGSWDYPLRPFSYGAYRAAEGLRGFWYKKARKRLGGGRR